MRVFNRENNPQGIYDMAKNKTNETDKDVGKSSHSQKPKTIREGYVRSNTGGSSTESTGAKNPRKKGKR